MEKICKRCKGSGQLFRPKPKKFLCFKVCTSCGGSGLKGSRIDKQPAFIIIHTLKKGQFA